MVLKVELLSKEMMMKPSSPTPPHLKTFKLSFLDQISPPCFIPLIFFFHDAASNGEDDHRVCSSQLLKQSLSKVLTLFYPLAGRIKGNDFIDCSDDGALWVEARVHGFLKDVVENPLMEDLEKFLPIEPYSSDDSELLLGVKVNYFLDGGIAIGVCVSHKIADTHSLVNFVNAWAVTAREGDAGGGKISPPNFRLVTSLFPPTTTDLSGLPTLGLIREKVVVTKRVVFDKEKLAALKKSAAAESSGVGNPTRVEALSAFLWKHFREARRKKSHDASMKKIRASHNVNLRARMNPALPDDAAFGNLWSPVNTTETPCPEDDDDDLVFQLRTSIREINAEYVEALQNEKGQSEHLRKWYERLEAEFLEFTSWCRFPIYEVDFGWGRPVWACTTTFPFKNFIVFMSTKCGHGIEAWINLGEEDDDIYMGAGLCDPIHPIR
ncbi:PREDICTED: vinorine synthase-like [Ipomoea nil]|uniref:vinorine synthase-like n=1 Tax=Ipomoea nil TaxID=35883 RepID=UPI00090092A2|nr:PREDICTED: vinorine synthase-like [Ipomoea nil]